MRGREGERRVGEERGEGGGVRRGGRKRSNKMSANGSRGSKIEIER